MIVLVMNSGSSSLKFQLIDMDNGDVMSKGLVERIGMGGDAGFEVKAKGEKIKKDVKADDHKQAVALVIDALTTGDLAVVDDLNNIDAIAEQHGKGAELNVEFAANMTSVPYHPGAAKYFAEQGLEVATK